MKSKRRVIVGWRQLPVQKVRTRMGRPAAAPAAGVSPAPSAPGDVDDEAGDAPAPALPGPAK